MIVVDPKGNLFDERRKKTDRRKKDEFVAVDRRSGKDRRTDEWAKDLLEDDDEIQEENPDENSKETQEEN